MDLRTLRGREAGGRVSLQGRRGRPADGSDIRGRRIGAIQPLVNLSGEVGCDHGSNGRDRDQSGHPGDGVVDARGDAEWAGGADESTVAVSGATVIASPRPSSMTPGSTAAK